MSKFHLLRILSKEFTGGDAVVIELAVPNELRETFSFLPGQYLNVVAEIKGKEVRRSYSICTAPGANNPKIGVRHVPGGQFSTYALKVLAPGDTLGVMPPAGKFVPAADRQGVVVCYAAGSGITPILSIITDLLTSDSYTKVVLIYGNRTTESIMFRNELEALKNLYLGRFSIHHILSREVQSSDLFNGRLNAQKLDIYAKIFFDLNEVREHFICGPMPMIFTVKEWLEQRQVPGERIKFELFSAGVHDPETEATPRVKQAEPAKGHSSVVARVDGNTFEFSLSYSGQNLLDAAISAGADAPFSCKGGVCSTCKAMLMEGQVEMQVAYGLEPDEIDDGYILTCQSHPRSDAIVVDYDV